MLVRLVVAAFLMMALTPFASYSQDAKTVLDKAARAMGVTNLKTLQLSMLR